MEDKRKHPELGKDGIPISKDCANGTCNCEPDQQPNDAGLKRAEDLLGVEVSGCVSRRLTKEERTALDKYNAEQDHVTDTGKMVEPSDVEVKPIGWEDVTRVAHNIVSSVLKLEDGLKQHFESFGDIHKSSIIGFVEAHIYNLLHQERKTTQQTVTQLQEKIADIEAKLKVADRAMEAIKDTKLSDTNSGSFIRAFHNFKEIAQSALDTIRKEQGNADKS